MITRSGSIEISEEALHDNLSAIHSAITTKRIYCAVKANAYGHGIKTVVPMIERFASRHPSDLAYAVATLAEAQELCSLTQRPILVLQPNALPLNPSLWEGLAPYHQQIELLISDFDELKTSLSIHPGSTSLNLHLAVDTGMGREGFSEVDEMIRAMDFILHSPQTSCVGIMTHFASSGYPDSRCTPVTQIERFQSIIKQLPQTSKPFIHIANSYSLGTQELWDFHEAMSNAGYSTAIRPGISLYGVGPTALKLQSIMTWKAPIALIKSLKTGDTVSYGSQFVAPKNMRIALVQAGYADGYNLRNSNKAWVSLQRKRCPVLGRICMDLFMIDISHLGHVEIGEQAILLGNSKDGFPDASLHASWRSSIAYEVFTSISPHIQREP